MIEQFLSRADARRCSLSQHELERRWKGLRERMAAKKIDYLLVQSQNRGVGGYFRYFTDMPGGNYPNAAVFPLKGEMAIISHGPASPAPPQNPPDWALREGKIKFNTPAFPNVWWEDGWDAEKAVEYMLKKKPKKVGLVGLGNMSAALYENVKKGLPGVEFVNATDLVDELRMVKSEEELTLHREAAYMHEMSLEVAKEAIEPGRTVEEVIQDIRFAQMEYGSEEQQVAIAFGQPGKAHPGQMSWGNTYIRRKLKEGDIVNLLVESSMAGGYWYDMRRFLSIGPVPAAYREAWEIAKEARAIMAANCMPGMLPGAAAKACDKFLVSKGCPAENRVAGHGQGLDLVERPVFLKGEVCKLEVGMIVCLHPTAKTKHAAVCLSDTYVVTESGALPLYRNLFDDDEIAVVG
jgi:Xaa-Pro aminopeptidase